MVWVGGVKGGVCVDGIGGARRCVDGVEGSPLSSSSRTVLRKLLEPEGSSQYSWPRPLPMLPLPGWSLLSSTWQHVAPASQSARDQGQG